MGNIFGAALLIIGFALLFLVLLNPVRRHYKELSDDE